MLFVNLTDKVQHCKVYEFRQNECADECAPQIFTAAVVESLPVKTYDTICAAIKGMVAKYGSSGFPKEGIFSNVPSAENINWCGTDCLALEADAVLGLLTSPRDILDEWDFAITVQEFTNSIVVTVIQLNAVTTYLPGSQIKVDTEQIGRRIPAMSGILRMDVRLLTCGFINEHSIGEFHSMLGSPAIGAFIYDRDDADTGEV